MTFTVHQGGRLIGTADLDPDLLSARLIAGKAAYRATTGSPVSGYRERLALRMGYDSLLVSRAVPDQPMQARKKRPGTATVTRVRDDLDVPVTFRFSDTASIRYNTRHCTAETDAWIAARVAEAVPALTPVRADETRQQLMLDRIVRQTLTVSSPLTRERNRLTATLAPIYDEIAEILSVDRCQGWYLLHPDTGLRIDISSLERSRSVALSAYRSHLIKTGQHTLLTVSEEPKPSSLSITRYRPEADPEAEQDEIDGD